MRFWNIIFFWLNKGEGGGDLARHFDLQPISAKKGGGDLAWIQRYSIIVVSIVWNIPQKNHTIPTEVPPNNSEALFVYLHMWLCVPACDREGVGLGKFD